MEFGAEDFVSFFAASEADDGEGVWEIAIGGDIIESGDEFSEGEITGGAEDDDRAGLGGGASGEGVARWDRRIQSDGDLG